MSITKSKAFHRASTHHCPFTATPTPKEAMCDTDRNIKLKKIVAPHLRGSASYFDNGNKIAITKVSKARDLRPGARCRKNGNGKLWDLTACNCSHASVVRELSDSSPKLEISHIFYSTQCVDEGSGDIFLSTLWRFNGGKEFHPMKEQKGRRKT